MTSRLALNDNSVFHLLLLNARGPHLQLVADLESKIPSDRWSAVEFEEDMPAAYAATNYFIHTPIDRYSEAFGQVYVEALDAGVPSIFTVSGIAGSLIVHEQDASLVPFRDSVSIYFALSRLIGDPLFSSELSRNGVYSVGAEFQIESM